MEFEPIPIPSTLFPGQFRVWSLVRETFVTRHVYNLLKTLLLGEFYILAHSDI